MSDQSHLSVQDLESEKKKVYCFLNMFFFSAAFVNWGDFKSYGFEAFGSFCSV